MKLEDKQKILERLTKFCHYSLNFDNEALDYLKNRRLSDQTIVDFQIGVFPSNIDKLFRHFSDFDLRQAGIISVKDDKLVSKFTDSRLIIPVKNVYNETVAFTTRCLYSEEKRKEIGIPKYDSTVYKKRSVLFGLDRAVEHIRRLNKVLVVEGNFCTIHAHQAGNFCVVASGGTFLSKNQMALLLRYVDRVSIAFDNDAEGQAAQERIIASYAKYDVKIKAVAIPTPYKDLAEFFENRVN